MPVMALPVFGGAQHDPDIDEALQRKGHFLPPWPFRPSQPFYDLAYADDAAIFTGTAERGQQILHTV